MTETGNLFKSKKRWNELRLHLIVIVMILPEIMPDNFCFELPGISSGDVVQYFHSREFNLCKLSVIN